MLGAAAPRAAARSARDRTAEPEVPAAFERPAAARAVEPWSAPHRALQSLGAWDLAPSPVAELLAHDDADSDDDGGEFRGGLAYLAVDGTIGALRVDAEAPLDE